MSSPVCERAMLVEAMFDGRLGPSEQASTERHLKGCAACAERLHELAALREMLRSSTRVVPPLEHQRERLALLRSAATPPAKKRRFVMLLAVALAGLPLAVWAASSLVGPPRARDTGFAPSTPVERAISRKRPIASASLPGFTAPTPVPPEPPSSPAPASSGPVRARDEMTAAQGSLISQRPRHGVGEKKAQVASLPADSAASREFAQAMGAISRGDFAAGASQLEGFGSAHPGDARVEEAAYLVAIALERAARLPEARAAARRYLAAYPDGAHRGEARRIAGN